MENVESRTCLRTENSRARRIRSLASVLVLFYIIHALVDKYEVSLAFTMAIGLGNPQFLHTGNLAAQT
jgi:hypothetical protein